MVALTYPRGDASHTMTLTQNGDTVTGQHKGVIFTGTMRGTVRAGTVELRSTMPNPGNNFSYTFHGTVNGNRMSGTVDMGEYGSATWEAVKA